MRNQKWHTPFGEAFADAGSFLLTSSALAFAAVEGVMRAEEEGRECQLLETRRNDREREAMLSCFVFSAGHGERAVRVGSGFCAISW